MEPEPEQSQITVDSIGRGVAISAVCQLGFIIVLAVLGLGSLSLTFRGFGISRIFMPMFMGWGVVQWVALIPFTSLRSEKDIRSQPKASSSPVASDSCSMQRAPDCCSESFLDPIDVEGRLCRAPIFSVVEIPRYRRLKPRRPLRADFDCQWKTSALDRNLPITSP